MQNKIERDRMQFKTINWIPTGFCAYMKIMLSCLKKRMLNHIFIERIRNIFQPKNWYVFLKILNIHISFAFWIFYRIYNFFFIQLRFFKRQEFRFWRIIYVVSITNCCYALKTNSILKYVHFIWFHIYFFSAIIR